MQRIFMLAYLTPVLFTLFISGKYSINRQDDGSKSSEIYVCIPCGSDCDAAELSIAGTCSHCNMKLVKKSTIKHHNVAPGDLCAFITKAGSKNVLLLDVRTIAEFEGKAPDKFGRLKNAINIPIQELETRIKELAAYKDKEIVVYCSHSHRSPQASYMLSQNGFSKVTNMMGGMSVWKSGNKCDQELFIPQ